MRVGGLLVIGRGGVWSDPSFREWPAPWLVNCDAGCTYLREQIWVGSVQTMPWEIEGDRQWTSLYANYDLFGQYCGCATSVLQMTFTYMILLEMNCASSLPLPK
mmetsp:Transcript_21556/g.50690  ORF Transcript_21556/g.50690 Transcript_21556/m.50690 type:complete len:104 (-) Transcript_21556:4-315(-)